ncbi:WYL domain-containing protein [Fusobacterium simiae]|uniref:WYL domain-containing protein n=1 Tax=Fusobacterium simiae TaxID=855 RepID=A0ABT4DN53_FUSSI|nr:WYL domain-containing protein [Fusobacterium simiae]MCY7008916.1 WYL domain-containing protein [Fusobacterium simiae]
MKRAERLNQELIFLSSKKSFNLSDLINEFNISKRTALRDIQDLEAMGLPFYVENGRNGGYKLINEKLIIPVHFDIKEMTSIFFALKSLEVLSTTPFEKSYPLLYKKLLATLPLQQKEKILKLLNVVEYYSIPPINPTNYLTVILEAILDLKVLDIIYTQHKKVSKNILPYNLFYRNGVWFCYALDINNNVFGVYRCDYIEECIIDNKTKYSYTFEDLETFFNLYKGTYHNIEFRCTLTKFGKELFLKKNYPNMKLEEINNQCYMTGSFNEKELDYMVHYLIGLGENVKIEYPEILKSAYIKKLKEILKKYE